MDYDSQRRRLWLGSSVGHRSSDGELDKCTSTIFLWTPGVMICIYLKICQTDTDKLKTKLHIDTSHLVTYISVSLCLSLLPHYIRTIFKHITLDKHTFITLVIDKLFLVIYLQHILFTCMFARCYRHSNLFNLVLLLLCHRRLGRNKSNLYRVIFQEPSKFSEMI